MRRGLEIITREEDIYRKEESSSEKSYQINQNDKKGRKRMPIGDQRTTGLYKGSPSSGEKKKERSVLPTGSLREKNQKNRT